jgi:hypothetical protein
MSGFCPTAEFTRFDCRFTAASLPTFEVIDRFGSCLAAARGMVADVRAPL